MGDISGIIIRVYILIITTVIVKKGRQLKVGRERLTPYQSEDPSPKMSSHRKKEEKR